MNIQDLDVKKVLVAGSAMAVMSGFVPNAANAQVGTATIGIDVDIVTAITLTGTAALDFGRIAITGGGPASGNHTLSPAAAVNAATNTAVVVAGVPGSFNISGGTAAANVSIALAGSASYNAGNIVVNQLTFGGPGMTAGPCVVGTAAPVTTCAFAGGAATDVQVGGRLSFSGTPAVGAYTGQNITVNITDIP